MKYIVCIYISFSAVIGSDLIVGSKKFTESVILGEVACQIAASKNIAVQHKAELGGTRLLWNALLAGEIDIYPEYSGTLQNEILADKNFSDFEQVKTFLDSTGIVLVGPLGFNNTYAMGVLQQTADMYHLKSISDLAEWPAMVFGFTNEFMDREDGWPALKKNYNLPQKEVYGLDHDLAYKALQSGTIQLTDLYSTDAEIKYYELFILEDDKEFFPRYYAFFLARKEIKERFPNYFEALASLYNGIDEQRMVAMNAAVKIDKVAAQQVAARFVLETFNYDSEESSENIVDRLYKNTMDHLVLVLISLFAAILVSIPLGILSIKKKNAGHFILGAAGILQTIPSLAILVFMIPLMGIGAYPAMTALFLYSLLPIIRNTNSGIADIPSHIIESAKALGLTSWERLRFVELPLAARSILAGIKTAAVINVGTATLGALIGAGGYGQPILTGIRLDDSGLILEGAVPAAILALCVQGIFDIIEKRLIKH